MAHTITIGVLLRSVGSSSLRCEISAWGMLMDAGIRTSMNWAAAFPLTLILGRIIPVLQGRDPWVVIALRSE